MPIRFNDGTAVGEQSFQSTYEEIVDRFGAVTIFPQVIHGIWIQQGRRYEEDNIWLSVDVEDTPENAEFFRRWKAVFERAVSPNR